MNILMVLDHISTDQRVENEAESLVDAGHKVTVLSFADDNRYGEIIIEMLILFAFK